MMNPGRKRLAYLCLEGTVEGQASYTHVHEIIKGLKDLGWEITLHQPSYPSFYKKPSPLIRFIKFAFVQWRMWKSLNVDIVYIRAHFAAWPTALWARLQGIPVIQEVNGPYEDLFIGWPFTRYFASVFRWLLSIQYRWASAIIAVTPQLAEWVCRESGNSKVYVIPNGVNTELFVPHANTTMVLPDKFVIFFGALARWQGVDTMLEAIERPEWPREVKLVIVGDGAERSKIEEAARQGKAVYLGTVPYVEMAGLIARSMAGLSPKDSVGGRAKTGLYPLKVFEALACGVPVIVTDFPGQADLVREGKCGLIIPPEDPRALAEAVAYFYHHPEERRAMGERGRKLVEEEHSWRKRAADTDRVLHFVLRN
jgi:glycosyltransferase involved in cell wall biosynthesis